jgi:hypothetical protein
MKFILAILMIFIVAVLASGCTTQAPATTQVTASPTASTNVNIPDMTGVWKGTGDGYTTNDGFTHYPAATLNITAQKGQIFIGKKEYPRIDGKTYYENFSGIITTNGEFYEADSIGGFAIGKLITPNSLEMNYLEEGNDTKALVAHFTRRTN